MRVIMFTIAVCSAIALVTDVLADPPEGKEKPRPLTSKDLSGTWRGEQDGVTIQLTFRGTEDATWQVGTGKASIGADLKRVDDKKSGTVYLRLDYVETATGKSGSVVVGQLESGDSGIIRLTILPAATKHKAEYKSVERVPLSEDKSIEEDQKRFTASKWQNEKPEAAWNKLPDMQKEQLGGKPWKNVELEVKKLGDSPDPQGRTHSVQLSFFKPDDEKFSLGTTSVEIREEKGKRLLVVTNLDKVEYKIEYEFKGDKLQMRGSYLRREPSSGAIFILEVFDGEYVAIPFVKK
jgi:hypothetical protein